MTDWPVKTLGDLCEVFDDGDWIESKDQAPSGVRLIQTGNVGDGEFKDRSDKARFVSESTFSRLRCTEIFPGDLLVSRLPDPVGRACLIPDTGLKMITAVDCTIMRPRKDIMLPQFLVSSTQTSAYREQVRAKITGTTRDRISRSNLAEIQVSVPPLEEQQRIVALLDAATERIAELTACYEQARTYANNLFTSALRDSLESDQSAPLRTLDELCEEGIVKLGRGNIISKKDIAAKPGSYPIYSSARENEGKFGEYGDYMFDEEMITWSIDGGGRLFYRPKHKFSVTNVGGTLRVLDPRLLDIQYLHRVLQNLHSQRVFDWVFKAHPSVIRKVYDAIPMPPLAEQKQIVARLDSMRAKTSEMVAAYDAKLTAAKNLRQSILESAFAGGL